MGVFAKLKQVQAEYQKGNPMLEKIVSGGHDRSGPGGPRFRHQTRNSPRGVVPKGRLAEDGTLADRYELKEMPSDSYSARTEQNVIDSDG